MAKCDFEINSQGKELAIYAPSGRMLPGRMLRNIVRVMEEKYEFYEYFLAKDENEINEMDNVVGRVPVGQRGMRGGKYVVFQTLHESMYNPDFLRLTDDEMVAFHDELDPDEVFYKEDYTVDMPDDYLIIVTNEFKKFVTVTTHLKLKTLAEMRTAVARLASCSVAIFDSAVMLVEYNDDEIVDMIIQASEGFVKEPVEVKELSWTSGEKN